MIDDLDDLTAELARARFDLERSLIGADNARRRIRDLEIAIRALNQAIDPQQEAAREGTSRTDSFLRNRDAGQPGQ